MYERMWSACRKGSYLAVLALFPALSGCGDAGGTAKDSLKGKVTLNTKPVAGLIVFVNAEGKELSAPLGPDGSFTVENPPAGEVTVVVRTIGGVGKAKEIPGGAVVAGKGGSVLPSAGTGMGGEDPPAKYGDPKTSPLKYTITAGHQTKNFELTP